MNTNRQAPRAARLGGHDRPGPTFLELVGQIESAEIPLRPDKLELMRQLEPRARGMAAQITRAVGMRIGGHAQQLVAEAIRTRKVTPEVRRSVAEADAAASPTERVAWRLERLERFWRACSRAYDDEKQASAERRGVLRETTLAGAPVPAGAWTHSRGGAGEIACQSPRGTRVEAGDFDDSLGVTRTLAIVGDGTRVGAQLRWNEFARTPMCTARIDGELGCEVGATTMAECVAILVGGIEYDLDRRAVSGPEHDVEEGERYHAPHGTVTFELVHRGHAGMTCWLDLQPTEGETRRLIVTVRSGRGMGFTISRPDARHGDHLAWVRALPYETSSTKMLAMAVAFAVQRYGDGSRIPAIPRSRRHQD